MEAFDRASPRTRARITGTVYLLFFVTAVLSAVVAPGTSGLAGTPSDAATTANSIVGHRSLYELSVALGLVSTAFYVALAALFYLLFRPVSRSFALLAAFFQLIGNAVTAVGSVFQLGPLVVLGGSGFLGVFDSKQLQAMALVFLNLSAQSGYVALVFFGVFQLFLGYLIWRSTFLPRILGALVALAGVGWLTFLWPPLAAYLLTYLEVVGFAAEALLMLWLLVLGVNSQRWEERARSI